MNASGGGRAHREDRAGQAEQVALDRWRRPGNPSPPGAEGTGGTEGTGGIEPQDGDPTALPLFATPAVPEPDLEHRHGRVRSDFTLRALVPNPDTHHQHDSLTARRSDEIDWELIAQYRAEASDRLTARLETEGGQAGREEREAIGRDVIAKLLQEEAAENVSSGHLGWDATLQDTMAVALFDALFGLGRIQPLVDDDTNENIILIGWHTVWLEKIDGTLVAGPRVADSAEELRLLLSKLAGDANRPFDQAHPSLHLRLPGGARLAATDWVTADTSVVIRRHRTLEVSMDEMTHDKQACSSVAANFLAAAVRAGRSLVVSGVQGSGKTTWVRALCSEIPPWEAIGTFETEFELHLHELTKRHRIVHAWEHRPGSAEIVDGRRAGEFTLAEAIRDSFRFNLARQIVGEVRGHEVWEMLRAMESGPGSISTTHARTAEHTIEKLVSCAMEMGPHVTRELAVTKLSAAIDIVMHLHVEVVPDGDESFRKNRWLQEVLVVDPSHDAAKGYEATPVFKPGPDGRAVATGDIPDRLRQDLVRFGFDLNAYQVEANLYGGAT
jgi:pilus assembly protein CpaF